MSQKENIFCFNHIDKSKTKEEIQEIKELYKYQGLSQAAPLRQSRTAIGIVPLQNGQGDNLSPSKFREKTRKEAHTKRLLFGTEVAS